MSFVFDVLRGRPERRADSLCHLSQLLAAVERFEPRNGIHHELYIVVRPPLLPRSLNAHRPFDPTFGLPLLCAVIRLASASLARVVKQL